MELQLNKQKKQNEQQIKALNNKIDKLKNRKRNAQNEYFDGNMPKHEYNDYINSVNQEINDILKSKQVLEYSIKNQDDLLAFTDSRTPLLIL